MKKSVILLFVSLALLANAGIAQDFRSSIHIGPKIGINVSNVYDSEGNDLYADGKIGLAAGLFVSIPLGRFLGIQPEILFSQKGFKTSGSILGDDYTFTRTLNFIDVPLLITIKPSTWLTIVAGPQYSYLIGSKDAFENSFLDIDLEQEFDNDNLRKNTLCFLGGLDINLNRIVVGTRIGWDLFKNDGDGSTTNPRYKNAWLQATIGYRL
jgi:hypothetical protein